MTRRSKKVPLYERNEAKREKTDNVQTKVQRQPGGIKAFIKTICDAKGAPNRVGVVSSLLRRVAQDQSMMAFRMAVLSLGEVSSSTQVKRSLSTTHPSSQVAITQRPETHETSFAWSMALQSTPAGAAAAAVGRRKGLGTMQPPPRETVSAGCIVQRGRIRTALKVGVGVDAFVRVRIAANDTANLEISRG